MCVLLKGFKIILNSFYSCRHTSNTNNNNNNNNNDNNN